MTGKTDVETIGATLAELGRMTVALSGCAVLKGAGLGLNEWLFLRGVRAWPKLAAGGVGRRLGMTPQYGVQIVQVLKKGGYLSVQASVPEAGRKTLSLTERGSLLVSRTDDAIVAAFAEALKARPFSLAVMRQTAKKVTEALK